MKPYGYKTPRKMIGDGCFLCTRHRKKTKKSVRHKAKIEIKKEVKDMNDGD